MGTNFVGSDDYNLCTAQAITSTITVGAWVDLLQAKMHELVITTTGVPTDTLTLKLETQTAAGVFEAYSGDFTANSTGVVVAKLSLGGLPGGRRVRYTAVMDANAAVLTADLRETRSGLA
jgi:hypothetical protein